MTVDSNGKVTAIGAGTATITATTEDGGKTASCVVTVTSTSISVTLVSLNKTTLTLEKGTTETLTATVVPDNATNKNVTWTSSNTTVASVDANGKVTAVGAGTATITVTTEDGRKTAACTVTVNEPITIAKKLSSINTNVNGKKATLTWKAIKKNKKGKKLLKQIKSIQVQYSTDPNFKQDVKTKRVGKKKTKVTLKLKRKKTYYVRMRYVGSSGVSAWSKVKKVKTK